MSSSRDNRRENRDVTRSLADKDGQVQALQERILKMEEEIARKDIAITSLSGRVKSLLEKNLQYCAGEFKEASDEVKYLDVCASVIGKKVRLVREWLLMNSTTYVDALDDVESLSYSKLLKEIEQIEGLWGMHLLHFFDRLFIESRPLRTDHPQKPREIYQLFSILLSVDNSKYRHPFSYIYNSYFLEKTSSKEAVDVFGKLLPGGISYSDGLHIRKKHVEEYKELVDTKSFRDSLKADVFHVFDNNGVYKQGTGGQGINSSSVVSVWTNRLLILKKDSFIQRHSKHSMRSQSKRHEADLGLFYFNSGATEKACENDENKSPFTDLEYFDGELRLHLDEAIADRADYNSFRFTISEEQPSLDDKGHEIPRGGDPCVLEHRAT